MKATIAAICIGQSKVFRDDKLSAIAKAPVIGKVAITSLGINGDEQADRVHHGGVDMAVHHYPLDHYAWWDTHLGGHDLLSTKPAFGENLVHGGMSEEDVHIGDQFRLGTALLELSQPRQPCWKIDHRFERKGMVATIIKQHNCGWYYRVLEEGEAQAGDTIERVATGDCDWTIARLFAKLYDPNLKASLEDLTAIAALEKLSPLWRTRVQSALNKIIAGPVDPVKNA